MKRAKTRFPWKGTFHLYVYDKDGKLVDERHIPNLLLNRGRDLLTAMIGNLTRQNPANLPSNTFARVIGLGANNTAANVSQTGLLQTLVAQECENITQVTTSVTNDTLRLQTSFMNWETGGGSIQEIVVCASALLTFPATSGIARSVVSPAVSPPQGGTVTAVYTLQCT